MRVRSGPCLHETGSQKGVGADWRLQVLGSLGALGEAVADLIIVELRAKPESVLALPTGRTPLPVYRALVRANQEGRVSFANAHIFQLDEFYPIEADHPGSFRCFLETNLLHCIDVDPANVHSFDGMVDDPQAECDRIEAEIEAAGGLDLALLGIGRNGHIAFNEPGTAFDARTHLAELDPDTREAASYLFSSVEDVPCWALTVGLGTIMDARWVVMIASGLQKADAVRDALEGPSSPQTPASVLRDHHDLLILLDREAASRLAPHTLEQSRPGLDRGETADQ